MKKTKMLILSMVMGISLMLFVLLAVFANINKPLKIDSLMFNFCNKISTDGVIEFTKVFTTIGSIYALAIFSLCTLFFKNKIIGLMSILSLGCSAVACVVVKYIIRRPRPAISHIEEVGYSFPSAHAMLTVVVLGFVAYILIKHLKNKPVKIVLASVLWVVAILVGFSRIMLGVHYLTDVLAGWLMAVIVLILTIDIYNHILKSCKRFKQFK